MGKSVYLVRASTKKRPAWYYIDVEPLKKPLLDRAIARKQADDLARFGTILQSGWGEEPPLDVQKKFKDAAYL